MNAVDTDASRRTTGLLISATNLAEVVLAADRGVDIVDIKDPHRGALGAADPQLWRAAAEALPPHARLSAALGEATEAASAAQVPARFAFAKAGPAGSATVDRLTHHWHRIRDQLPPPVQQVAVAYADHEAADCAPPEAILAAAARRGLRWFLIDTFVKDGRSTLDHLDVARLENLARSARQADIRWVLAGSLRLDEAERWATLRPHFVGLRGDVCEHSRTGTLVADRVERWKQYLARLE